MKIVVCTFTDNVVAPGENILWCDEDENGNYKPWVNPLNGQPFTVAPTMEELAECYASMYENNDETVLSLNTSSFSPFPSATLSVKVPFATKSSVLICIVRL